MRILSSTLAFFVSVLCWVLACQPSMPLPRAGVVDAERLGHRVVPGGVVNVVGGNGMIHRVDLSIDTRLGTQEIGATWNSGPALWRWSFDLQFDGDTFVDGTGARYDVRPVLPGAAIAGSHWVHIDSATLATKGGWVHAFRLDGTLDHVRWASSAYPRLVHRRAEVAGAPRTVGIDQCTAADACETVYAIGRDAAGRVARIDDRAGRAAVFGYDAEGRLSSARDGLDTAKAWAGTRYQYRDGQLSALTNSEGERTEWDHDARGRVLAVRPIGPASPVWRFRYLRGRPFSAESFDPTGARTLVRFDAQRRVSSVEDAEGDRTSFEWEGRRPVARVGPDGTRVEWTYQDDDVVRVRAPGGHVTRIEHAPSAVRRDLPFARAVARVEDDLGVLEIRRYDASGRLLEIENGAGETTRYDYDAAEMLASVRLPDGRLASYGGYGVHGHPTIWTLPGGTLHPTYDAVGNQTTGPDPGSEADPAEGGIRARSFDEDRNLASVALAEGRAESFEPRTLTVEHGSDGRRLAIHRPYGGDSIFDYDAFGALTQRRDRRGGSFRTTIIERDALGRITAVERANGMRQETGYDAAGRVARRSILRYGELQSEAWIEFEDGRLARILDSVHAEAESYTYDAHGRLQQIRFPGGEQIWHGYDARSRRVAEWFVDVPRGFIRELGTGYDAAGRIRTRSDTGRIVFEREFRAGRIAAMRYGNGVERSFTYGPTGSLRETRSTNDGGELIESTLHDTGCAYLLPHCSTHETRTYGGAAGFSREEYDLAPASDRAPGRFSGGRLDTEVRGAEGSAIYVFDALSNETRRFAIQPECLEDRRSEFDDEHSRLLHVPRGACGSLDYQYDEAGFAVARNQTPLSWDGAGRIRSIGDDHIVWDTLGRPLTREVRGRFTAWRFGGSIESDAAGGYRAFDLGDVVLDLVSDQDRYRHRDARNNLKFVTDETGDVIVHYQYEAYRLVGVVAGDAGSTEGGFAGGREFGGLVLLGHRVLDPVVGRFLAPDPVFQLVNQYAYTLGNPIEYWDPSGRYQVTLSRGLAIASLAAGTAALLVTAPALGTGLAVASLGLGAASLVADALEELAGQNRSGPGPCTCVPPGVPPSAPGGTTNGGSGVQGTDGSAVQLQLLDISVDPGFGAGLEFGSGFGFDVGFGFGFELGNMSPHP